MSTNSVQINRSSKQKVMESVYTIIRTRSGRVTAKDIERDLGSKYEAHYAILHLTKQGKIRRIKGFGLNKIEFYYQSIG
jgi:hypothetical protein